MNETSQGTDCAPLNIHVVSDVCLTNLPLLNGIGTGLVNQRLIPRRAHFSFPLLFTDVKADII